FIVFMCFSFRVPLMVLCELTLRSFSQREECQGSGVERLADLTQDQSCRSTRDEVKTLFASPFDSSGISKRTVMSEFAGTRIADSSSRNGSQLFIRTRNETLSVAAMRISNPDCSPVGIQP
ncbi:MAG: hypothetical protein DME92_09480, partial [Verrucomicrobia bacterium]